jgi:quercetin dioxygenase-like cupin family protein
MKVIAQAAQETFVTTPEGVERRILSYGGNMTLVQFTFAAGVTAPMHSHPHEQIGYVASNVRHGIVTHEPMVLLDCFTPVREDFLHANGAAR